MNNYSYIDIKLGEQKPHRISLAYINGNQKILQDKEYFNKNTHTIHVYSCKMIDKTLNTLDENKNILWIRVSYTINYFNTNQQRFRVKEYVYINGTLYQSNKDIKRIPKEIQGVLNELN